MDKAAADNKKESQITYTVDSYANGIAFGQHKIESDQDPRDFYGLRLKDDGEMVRLRSRYVLHKQNPFAELECNLMRLSRQGVLGSATIYFGTYSDPFFPFEGKFDASIKFLELFTRYTPGLLIVQTRSPLIVIAMPVLRRLGKRAAVTLGVETCAEEAVRRYTPGLPRVEERVKTAAALRNFGVEVSMQVSPVLPYGDWRNDAGKFAELLCKNADYVSVRPLTDGSEQTERKVRGMELSKALARDRKFHWLRPDSANPLITAIEQIDAKKLQVPQRTALQERQVSIFAA